MAATQSKLHGVPQNRERVYTIGHLRRRGAKKVFPISATNGKDSFQHEQTGQIGAKLFKQFSGEPFLSMNDAFMTDVGSPTASTVTARYYKGLGNHKDNMVLEKADSKSGINQIGMDGSRNRDNPNQYRVYGENGVGPALSTGVGGERQPNVPVRIEGGTQIAHSLNSTDHKGFRNQPMTGVLELINQSTESQDQSQTLLQRERIGVSVSRNKQEQQ